ncbi:Protein transport protein Sec61 subunit beta [Smittium culicis]|uniref:Protein transport protein Sec61 subunit beta n=1 Tax=Smittium culicis TaxID=133412 RepID=A0A1R1XP77_9FUNG|nr:Protein transport protein Sec61 subunit beta [Smittium culicis]
MSEKESSQASAMSSSVPRNIRARRGAAQAARNNATSRQVSKATGSSRTMMRLYSDDSPGLRVDPVVLMVMCLVFIASVFLLHLFGKFTRVAKIHHKFAVINTKFQTCALIHLRLVIGNAAAYRRLSGCAFTGPTPDPHTVSSPFKFAILLAKHPLAAISSSRSCITPTSRSSPISLYTLARRTKCSPLNAIITALTSAHVCSFLESIDPSSAKFNRHSLSLSMLSRTCFLMLRSLNIDDASTDADIVGAACFCNETEPDAPSKKLKLNAFPKSMYRNALLVSPATTPFDTKLGIS